MKLRGPRLLGEEESVLSVQPGQARLRVGLLAFGMITLLAVVALLTACGSAAGGAAKGRQLFSTNCANCHGDSGARIPAAQLDSVQFVAQLGDAGLTKAIAEGKGTMPAWGKARGGPLGDEQIKSIVEYLKGGGEAGPLPTGPGRSMYAKQCAGCHGDRGNRVPAADLSASNFLNSLGSEGVLQAIIEGKGTMPAFGKDKGGPFSTDQARQVSDYVKALGRGSSLVQEASLSSSSKEGKDLYGKNCLSCHGDKGNRIPAAPMNDKSYVQKLGESNMIAAITNGKGTMPAYGKIKGGPLSDSQIKSILSYVNDLAGASASAPQTSSAPSSVDGKSLYSKNCAACHGDKGSTLSSANLSDKGFVTKLGDGFARSIANGKGAMPGFKGKLKDEEVKAVIEYVKGLTGPASSPSAGAGSTGSTGAAAQPAGGPPTIPHTTAGRNQCLGCHAAGGVKPVSASHDGRTNDMCQACHKTGAASGSASGGAQQQTSGPPPISHTLQGREGVCLSCHGAGGIKPVPATHQGRDNATCTSCHKASSGGGAAAAPAASPSSPSDASSDANSSSVDIPDVTHTVKGREGACLQCHSSAGIAVIPPSSHNGRTNEMCMMCHLSPEATSGISPAPAKRKGPPKVPHKTEGVENQCLNCHGPNGLKPIPANHTNVKNSDCLRCHDVVPTTSATTLSAQAPPPAPDTHAGRSNDTCIKCHDRKFTEIP
ncbi:MAG: c-type cytochrome [Chloroflexota bacterium]|nr:MAG: c-type cytochrome [Chloroflexota bacterium]